MISHLATGYNRVEVPVLAVLTALTALTVTSWALRSPARRTSRRTSASPLAAAVRDTAGVAHTTAVIGHSTPDSGRSRRRRGYAEEGTVSDDGPRVQPHRS